jgi:hypothetical protein
MTRVSSGVGSHGCGRGWRVGCRGRGRDNGDCGRGGVGEIGRGGRERTFHDGGRERRAGAGIAGSDFPSLEQNRAGMAMARETGPSMMAAESPSLEQPRGRWTGGMAGSVN